MSKDSDCLPEVKVAAELTEKGFSASAKSRAITAFDRLIGDLIDMPRISISAFNQRRKARADVREAMIRRVGEKAIGKIETDAVAIDLVVDRIIAEEIRKQENKEQVAQLALEDLRDAPPTSDDDFNKEEFIDWVNVFSRYAEDASSERLRNLWAKVLAGQIRKHRAFSFGTLRLLSELDPAVAESFQGILKYRFKDFGLVAIDDLKGDELLRWTALEDAGFISGYAGMEFTKTIPEDGTFVFDQGDYAVVGKAKPSEKISLKVKKLTQAGVEVASILPREDGLKAIEAMVEQKRFQERALELRIVQIVKRVGNTFHHIPVRTIKGP